VDISIGKSGSWTVVSPTGEIDLHCSGDLRIEITRLLDRQENVLLDMGGVSYIDSSGIAAMVQSLSHARGLGRDFAVARPGEAVMRILRLTRLDNIFELYDSIDAASAGA
jgi:anti-sigma B factor antagonist